MDQDDAGVLPVDDRDRREWRRFHLPRLGSRNETAIRLELRARHGLSDRQMDSLLSFFAQMQLWAHVPRSRRGDPQLVRSWAARVLGIDLELRPGGRALMRTAQWDRDTFSWKRGDARVEILWRAHGTPGRGQAELRAYEVRVIAGEGGLALPPPNLWEYLAALFVRTQRESRSGSDLAAEQAFVEGTRPRQPRAGTPPDLAFYREVLARYDALMRDGSNRPLRQLAEEMGENPNTVKSWLRRGRRYTEGREQ